MNAPRLIPCLWIAAAAALVVSCGPDEPEVRPQEPGAAQWTISTEPAVVIGRQGGPPETELITVVGAAELPSGTLLIADHGAASVLVFTEVGEFVRRIGGRGDGPGEFQDLEWLRSAGGDTVVVFDAALRRFTWLTQDGVVRSASFPLASAHPEIYGPLVNGMVLQVERPRSSPGSFRTGEFVDSAVLVLYPLRGGLPDTIARVPAADIVAREVQSRGVPTRVRAYPPFGRTLHIAAALDRFAVGRNDTLRVTEYDSTGDVLRRLSSHYAPQRVQPADVAAWLEPGGDDRVESAFDEVRASATPPETMPAFSGLLYDSDGNLWVSEYEVVSAEAARYRVFSPAGEELTTVEAPRLHRLLSVSSSSMLGVVRDEDDVQMVVRYRITK